MTDDRSLERAARSWLEAGPTAGARPRRRGRPPPDPDDTTGTGSADPVEVAQDAHSRPRRRGRRDRRACDRRRLLPDLAERSIQCRRPRSDARRHRHRSRRRRRRPPHSLLQPAPARSWGDWQATSQGAIAGLFGANEPIQLSIDWQDGLHTWIQTTLGNQVLKSETVQAPTGEIDLHATGADTIGCAAGDLGRYGWSRSADGLFLTLTLVDDTCANRAAAMARTWVHSLSAVNDGGTGVFPITGWLKATLPSMRWALDDTGLHSFDATDPAISFVVITDPQGYDQPCGAGGRGPVPGVSAGGTASVTAYADYLRTRPGFDTTVDECPGRWPPGGPRRPHAEAVLHLPRRELRALPRWQRARRGSRAATFAVDRQHGRAHLRHHVRG